MARQQVGPQQPSPPSSRTASRVTKSRGDTFAPSPSTRRRSRMLAEASSSTGLRDMVTQIQLQEGAAANETEVEGPKGTTAPADMDVDGAADNFEKPFPIMNLPAEIRLEIYRACLTRPYNILLSKNGSPWQSVQARSKKPLQPGPGNVVIMRDDENDSPIADEDILDEEGAEQDGLEGSAVRSGRLTFVGDELASNTSDMHRHLMSLRADSNLDTDGAGSSNAHTPQPSRGEPSAPIAVYHYPAPSIYVSKGVSEVDRPQSQDPLLHNILLTSKEVYKEARSILYSENRFTLDLDTAISTLSCLHQRSRRQIKHIELEVPSYNEILDKFQETVRLSLRYCSGLKKLVINMPFSLPGADGSGTSGNATVYANGFDILRWLPQQCDVVLEGKVCAEIEKIVNKHLHLARNLDKLSYARRQLISTDTSATALGPSALGGCVRP